MSIFRTFLQILPPSSEAIHSQKLKLDFSLIGVELENLPVSKLTYCTEFRKAKIHFRKNELKTNQIYLKNTKEWCQISNEINYDIILELEDSIPEQCINSPFFLNLILENIKEKTSFLLSYYSNYDLKTTEVIYTNEAYMPILIYSKSLIISEKSKLDLEKTISEIEINLTTKNLDIHSLSFHDLFQVQLDKISSKYAVELITAKSRIEELFHSFQTNFEYFLSLNEIINKTKKNTFDIKYSFNLQNEIVISDHFFIKLIKEKDQKVELNSYKNLGFFPII